MDRLRLIFTCCHPALTVDARVALTLRLLCGLTTAEVAHAFLASEATMAARITRAKKKIAAARIPYQVPGPGQLPERLAAVLDVVHLVFTTGHTAPAGAALQRRDLAERALDLARMLRLALPRDPGVAGLLALILLTDARPHARTGPAGRLLVLADQDRAAWDHGEISEGLALAREALAHRPYTRYPLMAAIAASHATAPRFEATDWAQILALYDQLITIWPSPIVALNRAVALGQARGPAAGWPPSTPSPPSRSWPVTTTCPPPAPNTSADSTAPRRPSSPTTRPCCWPATPPNATISPPAALASTPNPHSGPAPDSSDGQSEAWALRCVQARWPRAADLTMTGHAQGPFDRVRPNMGLVSALLADRQSIGDTTETNAITCSSARPLSCV
jgi:hypothetical protein